MKEVLKEGEVVNKTEGTCCVSVYENMALKGVEVTIGYEYDQLTLMSFFSPREQIQSSEENFLQLLIKLRFLLKQNKHTSTEPTSATEMCPSSSGSSLPAAPSQNKCLCNL